MREGGTQVEIRPLEAGDLRTAGFLHEKELPHEFLTRFGPGFLSRYYRAFVESPHATALGAWTPAGGRDELQGVLIGTFDTGAHYAYLVRHHGRALAVHTLLQSFRRPKLAFDVLRTRFVRYARGIARSLKYATSRERKDLLGGEQERVGFVAYVAVRGESRGSGVGGALFKAYEESAREAGLDRLDLVTLPDERGAGPFFSSLGWKYEGERVSRSGEKYAFYTFTL